MRNTLFRVALALAICAGSATANAAAAQTPSQTARGGTLTATTTEYTFVGNPNYGPWTIESLEYRWNLPFDVPAVTLLDRNDVDGPVAAHSHALYLDDYHTFSNRFYVYAQAGAAEGSVLPSSVAYLEGDLKLGPRGAYVLAAGGAAMRNADGSTTRYASLGPTIYDGRLAFILRFMPSNTNGIGTAATQLGVQYNEPGKNAVALLLVQGTQPNVLVGLPANAAGFQHISQETLTFKHWISPGAGFVLGGTLGNFTDASGASNTYRERGISFGVFLAPR